MDTYQVEITVNGTYTHCEFDSKIPFMLADQIKQIVKDYYKENDKEN